MPIKTLKFALSFLLFAGMILSLSPAGAQTPIVMGYLSDSTMAFTEKPVNVISPTWYYLSRKRGVVGSSDARQIEAAREKQIRVVPLIQSFNAKTLRRYIKTQQDREKLVLQMVPILLTDGIDGIQIDFENLYPEDKENFNQFMALLYEVASGMDKQVMIALPARTQESVQYKGFDYSFIGDHSHYVILMAYDENVRHPGPIASMDWVEATLGYAKSTIAPEKLLLGVPFYGRYWAKGRWGKGLSQQKIEKFYTLYGQHEPTVSDKGTFFRTEKGVVWYEGEEQLKAKMDLLRRENLAGLAIWRLGYEKSSFWQVIVDKLTEEEDVPVVLPEPLDSREISLATPVLHE